MTRRPWFGALALALLLSGLAGAQSTDDQQTRDHEEQDRRYMERFTKPQPPAPETNPATGDGNEQAFLELAESLVRDRNYRSASGARYRVQTDDPRIDPQAVVELLETFRDWFDASWSGRVELKPSDKTSRVFLFYSFHKYNQLLAGDFRFSPVRPKGHYGSAFDAVTLHSDADEPGNLGDTLVHEAAHQQVDRRFDWQAGAPPLWLSEGFASYYGYTLLDDSGTFHTGEIGGKSTRLFRDGKARRGSEAEGRMRAFRTALRQRADDTSLFDGLLRLDDPEAFYGQPDLSYGASWMLVHFLFHGDEGAHTAAFLRYLDAEQRGAGGADVLLAELGMTGAELDAAVERHARRVKVR